MLKTLIRRYVVTIIYAAYAKCGKITNGRLLQGKGLQIQINNKTIIEFGSRRI